MDPYSVDAGGAVGDAAPSEPAPPAVLKGTSAEVLGWVGDSKDRARQALAAEEESSKPRKGLVEELNELLDESDPVVVEAEDDTSK
jgi:hypothetical protein